MKILNLVSLGFEGCKNSWGFALILTMANSYEVAATVEASPTGSYLINLGITLPSQTVDNGLKPYGLVYDLNKNYNVPIKWAINPAKVKDWIDSTHNGIDYISSVFIVPAEFRTSAFSAAITSWNAMGVVGATSVSVINTEIFQTIDFMPIWPLDTINGGVAEDFMIDESIPENAYDFLDPQLLSTCYEFFVMLTPTLFVEIKNK